MFVAKRHDGHAMIGKDLSLAVAMGGDKLAQIGTALVDNARLNVEFAAGKKSVEQRLDTVRSVDIDRILQPQRPGIVGKRSCFEIVIGMVVRDENVAQRGQREFRLDELERRAVADIDDVGTLFQTSRLTEGLGA
jgi:hypothetical protein